MTPWQTGGIAFGMLAYAVAWTWGGRTERLGAVVLLLFCMISTITFRWETGGIYLTAIVEDCLRLLIFGWLSFRVDRWWPLVITAALTLMVLLYAAQLLDPAVTQLAVASANIGLGFIIDLTLLLSVCERWLAGEPAAGPAAWAKADRRATHDAAVRSEGPGRRRPVRGGGDRAGRAGGGGRSGGDFAAGEGAGSG